MNESACVDVGRLRAYLESRTALPPALPGTLPDAERAGVEAHLASCAQCRALLDDLRSVEARVTAYLSSVAPTQPPDLQAALANMRSKLKAEHAYSPTYNEVVSRQKDDRVSSGGSSRVPLVALLSAGRRRGIAAVAVAALLIISFASFPTLRAAADGLLQTFRAQSVLFVPVQTDRLKQLSALYANPTSLFIGIPSVVGSPATTTASSADEAGKLAGFTPAQLTTFPGQLTSTRFVVHDGMQVKAQVNVEHVRQLLFTVGITDITLPDALGSEPVKADVSPFIESDYVINDSGADLHFRLVQGHAPTVTLPKGVDLAQLGKAGLELIGMQPDQADQLSRQIDWSSTLVVPFPSDLSDVLRVQVGEAQGLLVGSNNSLVAANGQLGGAAGFSPSAAVYWQNGDRFYVLEGTGSGMSDDILLLAARAVK